MSIEHSTVELIRQLQSISSTGTLFICQAARRLRDQSVEIERLRGRVKELETQTKKQAGNYSEMLHALVSISGQYETYDQIRRHTGEGCTVDYIKALETNYHNIQLDAKRAANKAKGGE